MQIRCATGEKLTHENTFELALAPCYKPRVEKRSMRVLLIKMSSLGDVVHTLVPVTDAVRELPQLQLDWVVEDAYEAIPRWHPAVRRVIPIGLRRWRKAPWPMIRNGEWFAFKRALREDHYDLVLDAQGLLKSGWIGWQARGPVAGRSRTSAREPLATLLYKKRHEVDLALPEVDQLRQLFALALGYSTPTRPAEFGIDRRRLFPANRRGAYAVFAHGAAWRTKLWPLERWQELAKYVRTHGLHLLLPWGNEEEKLRAGEIANVCGGEVLPRLGIQGIAEVMANATFIVGLDTGLTHIAIALGIPTITLYGPSVPVYGPVAGSKPIHLVSSDSSVVDTARPNTVPLNAVIQSIEAILAPK